MKFKFEICETFFQNLENNNIGSAGVETVCRILSNNRTFESVSLAGNYVLIIMFITISSLDSVSLLLDLC